MEEHESDTVFLPSVLCVSVVNRFSERCYHFESRLRDKNAL